jgi:hypothetical protein
MAKQHPQNRSRGGPGSSHNDAIKPEPDQRHGPEPRAKRRGGAGSPAGAGNGISTTRITRVRSLSRGALRLDLLIKGWSGPRVPITELL